MSKIKLLEIFFGRWFSDDGGDILNGEIHGNKLRRI